MVYISLKDILKDVTGISLWMNGHLILIIWRNGKCWFHLYLFGKYYLLWYSLLIHIYKDQIYFLIYIMIRLFFVLLWNAVTVLSA